MKLFITSLLLLLSIQSVKAKTWNFYSYCNHKQANKEFIEKFPFKSYLQAYQVSNIDLLRKHYIYLQKKDKDADSFLIVLASAYTESINTQSTEAIQANLKLAEQFLTQKEDIFKIVADVIFQYLATDIEKNIKKGKLNKYNVETTQIIKQLARHQYIINVPMTKSEKLWKYATEGQWGYIWNRAMLDFPVLTLASLSIFILILLGGVYKVLKREKSGEKRLSSDF